MVNNLFSLTDKNSDLIFYNRHSATLESGS